MKQKEIRGLFYVPKEKILLYIPPYYTNGTGILKVLKRNIEKAEAIIRQFQPISDIYCSEITKSRRYKGMWQFHTVLDKCPDEAFELGEDWTTNDWIEH